MRLHLAHRLHSFDNWIRRRRLKGNWTAGPSQWILECCRVNPTSSPLSTIMVHQQKTRGVSSHRNALMPYATVSSTKFSFSISWRIRSIGIGEPAAIPVLLQRTGLDRCSSHAGHCSPESTEVNFLPCLLSPLHLHQYSQEMCGYTMQRSASFLCDRINNGCWVERLGRINDAGAMRPCGQISQHKTCNPHESQIRKRRQSAKSTHRNNGTEVEHYLYHINVAHMYVK